ncbi:MAG: hypothetical protein ABH833_00640 [Parcubacteria group bacterium]
MSKYIQSWWRLLLFTVVLLVIIGFQFLIQDEILASHETWEGTCTIKTWEYDNWNGFQVRLLCNDEEVVFHDKEVLVRFLNVSAAVIRCKVAKNNDANCVIVVAARKRNAEAN